MAYLAFAIATGFVSYFTIHRPILKELEAEGLANQDLLDHNWVFALILMFMGFLSAPFIIYTVLTGPNEALAKDIRDRML